MIRLVLVHGSATDHTTWSIQLASLRDRYELVAVDRTFARTSVAEHARDLVAQCGTSAVVVGSSFGAVIALELARTQPAVVSALVLIEPPMPASDEPVAAAGGLALFAEFERRVASAGGPAAGEFFLHTVLGDPAYERIPQSFRERSKSRWADIRSDSAALVAYRPRYAELATCHVPTLLLGGDRSAAYFRPTLDALATALPDARLEIIANAGHMLHAEAPRRFAELLDGFIDARVRAP
jgi:pimeloyl-ACP methyl ester carboxylesterase